MKTEGTYAMSKSGVDTSIEAIERAILPLKKTSPRIHGILLSRAREGYFSTHLSAGSIRTLASELFDEVSQDREPNANS